MRKYENELNQRGINIIAGVDEVGRGPLFGPVVAACVVLPKTFDDPGIIDSKKLNEKKREYYYELIIKNALSVETALVDNEIIDKVNIYQATKLAMKEAIEKTNLKLEHVLIDAMPLELDVDSTSIIKGDQKSISIAAASIIAKVTRDRIMLEYDAKHPKYGFKHHMGYPTKAHIEAINKYGLIDGYRKSYGPVKAYLEENK